MNGNLLQIITFGVSTLVLGSFIGGQFSQWGAQREDIKAIQKNHEEILKQFKLFVYPRPGCEKSKFDTHPNVVFTQAPMMDVSSTFIRDAIQKKKDVRFFVPEKVWEYLDEMNFYKK